MTYIQTSASRVQKYYFFTFEYNLNLKQILFSLNVNKICLLKKVFFPCGEQEQFELLLLHKSKVYLHKIDFTPC